MKISFDINVEDLIAFNNHYYSTDPRVRKQILRYRIIIPVFYLLCGVMFSYNGDYWNWTFLIGFGVAALLWSLFWPMWGRKRWLKRVRKEILQPENSLWFGRRDMELDDEEVTVVTEKGTETCLWSAFIKSSEAEDYFFLFQTPRQALVIPKSKITPAEVEELRSLFEKHIAVNYSEIENKK